MRDMDEAHRQDYADKDAMDELRRTIDTFLVNPPARLAQTTRLRLQGAVVGLAEDSARIVRAWN